MGDSLAKTRVIHRLLEKQAEKYGDRTFLLFKDKSYSFRELNEMAGKVATGLQQWGIRKADKVAIVMENCPEFLFLVFGLCKLGAVEVPINTAHKGDLLTYMLDKTDSRLIVTDSKFLDRINPVLSRLPKVEGVVVMDTNREGTPIRLERPVIDFDSIVHNDGVYKTKDTLWSDPFVIMFTSGTTGPSKGSLLPHNYALFIAEVLLESCEFTEEDCFYNILPLFHAHAQYIITLSALMCGAKMVLGERFSASNFWDDVRRYGCTESSYLGGILPILYKAEPKPDDSNNPLRVMVGGGAPRDILGPFEKRFGITLIEGYGLSEVGLPLMNTLRRRKLGSMGRPSRGFQVRIVDGDGLEVGSDVVGEFLVRNNYSYSLLLEYYNDPERTIEAWRDLWFHTGDYGYYDAEGYYYFVDRKKDYLRRRGENISSHEVEGVVNSHPAVLESAAIAAKSDLGEDEVMICLTLREGQALKPEELIHYCEPRMAYFMVPRYVRIMKEMPKTPTQRVEKYKLREEGITLDTWDREKAGYKLKR
jgi:crotonobetaine/carnitine-CoA ligase